jgi:steroid 5-alpha reductase family enzyme
LSLYLFVRNRGQGEDFRYREMRESWGRAFPWVSLFTVFLLQAGILWVVALPVGRAVRADAPAGWSAWDVAGTAVFAVGLVFETVGDWQLRRFKSDPDNRGKVLDRGLWRYTRHPNYFGDAVVWWGLSLPALSAPGSWWVLIGPALMTFLLMRVSGVALLEKSLQDTKPGYREYVESTSAFFPWFPKNRG